MSFFAAARRLLAFLLVTNTAWSSLVFADVIRFKDGVSIEGKVISENAQSVTIQSNAVHSPQRLWTKMELDRKRIADIEKKAVEDLSKPESGGWGVDTVRAFDQALIAVDQRKVAKLVSPEAFFMKQSLNQETGEVVPIKNPYLPQLTGLMQQLKVFRIYPDEQMSVMVMGDGDVTVMRTALHIYYNPGTHMHALFEGMESYGVHRDRTGAQIVAYAPMGQERLLVEAGTLARMRGMDDVAFKIFTDVLEMKQDSSIAHYELSGYYERKKNLDKAISEAEAAIRLQPKAGFYYLHAATLLKRNKQTDRAYSYFLKALSLDPALGEVVGVKVTELSLLQKFKSLIK